MVRFDPPRTLDRSDQFEPPSKWNELTLFVEDLSCNRVALPGKLELKPERL
jgi:hypothetical protein